MGGQPESSAFPRASPDSPVPYMGFQSTMVAFEGVLAILHGSRMTDRFLCWGGPWCCLRFQNPHFLRAL